MFKWRQTRHAIPENWKQIIRENLFHFNLSNGNMRSQHALFGANNYSLEKCTSKMFYQRKLKSLVEHIFQKKLPVITLRINFFLDQGTN